MKKRVLIIGCGFAGATTAQVLSKSRENLEVTIIDKRAHLNFLPVLPDAIGRGINPSFLIYPIETLSRKFGFNFVGGEVKSIDLDTNKVFTDKSEYNYDYLVIASGSETTFYDNGNIKNNVYKLDNVRDANEIIETLGKNKFDSYIIAGGGYTGIEVATNLRVYLNKKSESKRIIIVEKSSSVLGLLPAWMKKYVYDNLKELNIDIILESIINRVEDKKVFISNGSVVDNALVIWSSGVKTPDFVQKLAVEKTPQGRLKVDDYLRINDNVFAVGDTAYFLYNNIGLRMAVQFSITQAVYAGYNIISTIKGKPLRIYKPRDLGYIIPMANNKSCGVVLGFNQKGITATLFHYIMCIYRSYGFKNKWGIVKNLGRGRLS